MYIPCESITRYAVDRLCQLRDDDDDNAIVFRLPRRKRVLPILQLLLLFLFFYKSRPRRDFVRFPEKTATLQNRG